MSIFSWISKFFSKEENTIEQYSVIVRRGYEIILPREFYKMCEQKNYCLSIVFNKNNKPTSVQVTYVKGKEKKYIGTVRDMLNVAKFKNKNVCDFTKENIIEKGEKRNGKK